MEKVKNRDNSIRFSQNFLRHPRLVKTLLSKTNINSNDTVYDIGAGKGIIAAALADTCRTVITVELDASLAATLRQKLSSRSNAKANIIVYEADFLSLPLPRTPYKVFANIPFNLSADILRKLTEAPNPPATSYLIVQKEFAEKLAPPAGGYNSQLAISLGVQFGTRIIQSLQPIDFYPRPKVSAALLEISRLPEPLLAAKDLALFRDFIAYTYNAHQPNLAMTLSRLFTTAGFSHTALTLQCPVDATPSQLNVRQWLQLFDLALHRRSSLAELVGGYEEALTQKHHKRTKLHRTRFNNTQ